MKTVTFCLVMMTFFVADKCQQTNRTSPTSSTTTKPKVMTGVENWSYQDQGSWGGLCKTGENQSPILLTLEDAMQSPKLKTDAFNANNYNKTFNGALQNLANTVIWDIDDQPFVGLLPTINGGGLEATAYVLHHIRFHWGADDDDDDASDGSCRGSEHVVEGEAAPLEMQLLHYNSKYASWHEAQGKSDGVVALAFLFRTVGDNDQISFNFSAITEKLTSIVHPSNFTAISLDLSDIVPSWMANPKSIFFRYDGSLTAPPCTESVSWTVFVDRIDIPRRHLQAFRGSLQTMTPKSGPLEKNYRKLQLKNGRDIWTNGEGLAKSTVRLIEASKWNLFCLILTGRFVL